MKTHIISNQSAVLIIWQANQAIAHIPRNNFVKLVWFDFMTFLVVVDALATNRSSNECHVSL